MAQLATAAGARVVAIVSLLHAHRSVTEGGGRLVDLADVVIDNHGAAGDASVAIEGLEAPVAPTSTVAGAAIVNAIVAECVEILTLRGVGADIFASSNLDGGIAANSDLAARYRPRVRAL
jgi:uncharacterized phosphosugar-binding protein